MRKNNLVEEPLILVTNDDGIAAPGLACLTDALRGMGRIVVVAPDRPQSGMGHAITTGSPLRVTPSKVFETIGIEAWQCSGTPVDCVKIAHEVVLGRKPDYCFSGINHGSNASINVIYSGTMSAAMEGAIEGIPSSGFSLLDWREEADFTVAKIVVRATFKRMLKERLPSNFLLNINIPKLTKKEFKGIRICRQSRDKWVEHFVERLDPQNEKYYWMTGEFVNSDKAEDTDIWALDHGFASVVPVTIDFTDLERLKWLKGLL